MNQKNKAKSQNTEESNQSSGAKIEVISPALPKGGGAIKGIGETFQADEFTGTASLSIPFAATPCRGFEPGISVNYSSGAGNGIFGQGFSVGIPSISRQTSKGIPLYNDRDTFLFSGADYLVPHGEQTEEAVQLNGEDYLLKKYRPRVAGSFARIEYWQHQTKAESFWKVLSADNSTSIFGKTAQARIADAANPTRIFEWLLEETFDAHGNHSCYHYKAENDEGIQNTLAENNRQQTANRYLSSIQYGNDKPINRSLLLYPTIDDLLWHFEVVFDYGEYNIKPENTNPHVPENPWLSRLDPFSSYHAGFEIRTYRLCQSILMFHHFKEELGEHPVLAHALRFNYEHSPIMTQLRHVEPIGYRFREGEYTTKSMPSLEFGYTLFNPIGHKYETFKQTDAKPLLGVSQSGQYSLTDLYGEGIPGILYGDGQSIYYWDPKGTNQFDKEIGGDQQDLHYAPKKQVLQFPIDHQTPGAVQSLMDFTGNGRLDLLVTTPKRTGYYSLDSDNQWNGFQPLESVPTNYTDSLNQQVDVTGEGLSDIIRIEQDQVVVYPAKRKKGFGAAYTQQRNYELPTSKPDSAQELLRFGDILGAGTPQLVRITKEKTECWPSLGYGKFGKKITLDNSPQFGRHFDTARLQMVDIDGTGTADLVYIHSDYIQVFFNESGNRFSAPIELVLPQKWDNLSQLHFADVHGNGTQCLVFTKAHPQAQHWYYDFSQRVKPYMLNSINNNMGAKTLIHYRSSTHYYLKDKKAGFPWITSLPFPVQVVAKTEAIDFISNSRHCGIYNYHHGYYDEVEREFRGFGRVDRQDTESFDASMSFKVEGGDSLQLLSEEYHVPPAMTKTWYHTGAWYNNGETRDKYKEEFFKGDLKAKVFPDDAFEWLDEKPNILTQQESRRALKGMTIRQELYGLDDSEWAENPYTVSETQYHVKLLQERGQNRYAVFFIHSPESIAYQYERNPNDPMVSQEFVFELDAYGHPLKTGQVVYARRKGNIPQQKKVRVTYHDSSFIHLDQSQEYYLLGVPLENKGFELKDLQVNESGYFPFKDLKKQIEGHLPQATLLDWQRHYYFNPITQERLALGEVTPQALHCQTEAATFETSALKDTFKNVLNPEELKALLIGKASNQGGYTHYEQGDAASYYWNSGGTQHYLKAANFYQPHTFIDPFGQATKYEYDTHNMLVNQVTDPLGNSSKITKVDYQSMAIEQMVDPNGNTTEVLFDALGKVCVTAHYGQEGDKAVGFTKLDDYTLRSEPNNFEEILEQPKHYLQGAASFFYYDLFAWSGRIAPQNFEALNVDIPILWQTLVADGYISSGGGICTRFNSLASINEFSLSTAIDYDCQSIFDILKNSKKEVPLYAFNCVSEKYPAEESTAKDIHCSISYSDGFGRELQSKLQVQEAGEVRTITPEGQLATVIGQERWLTTGAIRYNNKGKPVKQYEPFYADRPHYLSNNDYNTIGAASEIYYDPLERVVMTKTTKGRKGDEILHLFSKVLYGAYDPDFTPSIWTELHYDANDTIKDSEYYKSIFDENGNLRPDSPVTDEQELNSLKKAAVFYDTPEKHSVDNLGRAIEQQQCLRSGAVDTDTFLSTYTEFDIVGNPLSMTDPRLHADGKTNLEMTYSLANEAIKTFSVDAGTHWKLSNAAGKPIFTQDSRAIKIRSQYDELQRPSAIQVEGQGMHQNVQVFLYGDSHYTENGNKKPFFTHPEKWNTRGVLVAHFEDAGLNLSAHYAFTGQALASGRLLNKDYKKEANWDTVNKENKIALAQAIAAIQKPEALKDIVIPESLKAVLEVPIYTTHSTYDALGRAITATDPDGNITQPHYYSTGLLEKVEMVGQHYQDAPSLDKITYDAKGQRQSVVYGNGVKSKYTYNDLTYELQRIHTQGPDPDNGGRRTLQDLHYYYDGGSNVCHIRDEAIKTVFCNNQKVVGAADYTYDSLYRLIKATGREHPGLWKVDQKQQKEHNYFNSISNCINDANKIQNYTETFAYDNGGNLIQVKHQAAMSQGCWTRNHTLNGTSNQLDKSTLGACAQNPTDTHEYAYDANGNQTNLDNLPALAWNYRNNIQNVTLVKRNDTPSDKEYYVYDSSGKRVRKVTERYEGNSCTIKETIYLGGFEIQTKKKGARGEEQLISEWHSIRFDPAAAIWRYWISGKTPTETKKSQVRYQLENHLNSSTMELDRTAQLLTYEEYYPYGGTAIMAGKSQVEFKQKQYRYSGKEKDAATGLYYYGMRYYSTWLGRWLSADPAGTVDGLNLYAFVGGNPVSYVDVGGMVKKKKKKNQKFNIFIEGKEFKSKGRPGWRTKAKKMKVKKNEDRRHVIHLSSYIIKPVLKIINNLKKTKTDDEIIKLLTSNAKDKKMKGIPKTRLLDKYIIYTISQLNSVPNNLNADSSAENQGIELIRGQFNRLNQEVKSKSLNTKELKEKVQEKLKKSDKTSEQTKFANQQRGVLSDFIDKIDNDTDPEEMKDIMKDIEFSVGFDINKKSSSKTQTSFAFKFVNEVHKIKQDTSKLTNKEQLKHMFSLNDMKK